MSSLGSWSANYSERDSINEAIITKIADLEDVDPLELPPLYEAVNTDALTRLVTSFATGPSDSGGEIAFSYYGYRVSIRADGSIELVSERNVDSIDSL